MKILNVCARYHPYVGGVQRIVKNVAEYLAKQNNQVTVYATDPSKKSRQQMVINGVKIKNYPALTLNEAYNIPHLKMLVHLMEEQKDIIHAHSVHDLTILLAHASHKLDRKPPLVVSPYYHGGGHTNLARALWIPYRFVVRKILKDADGIIVNSKVLSEAINKTFKPSCRMFLIHDGINLNEIKNADPFAFDENHRIMLYVGRLEKYKNVHVAVASLKYLPENYCFYIIGQGPFKPYLENLVQSLGIQNRVFFLGLQPDSIVYRWLKTAHVFVHLSDVESFGMTCIESLAAGTPVIANDDGFGLRETIALYREHIIMYKMDKQPASKVAELVMKAAELKGMTVDVARFSWDIIGKSVSRVYEQILAEQ